MKTSLKLLALLALPLSAVHADDVLSVYFIGNSLTVSSTPERVHQLYAERGVDLQFGSQLSGGKSLIRHLNYEKEPDQKWNNYETNRLVDGQWEPDDNPYWGDDPVRFGYYDKALVEHQWDKAVFQLYDSALSTDTEAISAFIDLALENKTCDTFYIYSTWPTRKKLGKDDEGRLQVENIDFPAVWENDYDFTMEVNSWMSKKASASRKYADVLLAQLNAKYANLPQPIRLIPVGEVVFALDQKIKAGKIPGLESLAQRRPDMVPGLDHDTTTADGANALYADPIHFNPMPHKSATLGTMVMGMTIYTVLSGQSPVGLSAKPYELDGPEDAALVKAIQETIWEVVTADPRTGVTR